MIRNNGGPGAHVRTLNELEPEERGTICEVNGNGALRRRLLDMGVVPGTEIEVVRIAPLGDPVEYLVKGYRLSLRRTEAANVLVTDLPCCDCPDQASCPHGRRRRRRRHRWRQRCLAWLRGDQEEAGRPGLLDATGQGDGHGP
jgi:Fe2+ transport system protein FeoA